MAFSPAIQAVTQGQNPQPQQKGGFLDAVGNLINNPFLMNLLAQQGYSPVPQSKLGAIGRAGLATQQQQQQQALNAAQVEALRARAGLANKQAATANAGKRVVQSAQPLANGNIGYLDAFTGKVIDTGHKAGGKGQVIDMPGIGLVEYDPVQKTITQVNPEDVIRRGMAERSLAESEGGRGRLEVNGEFVAQPGTEAAISETEEARKRGSGAFMKSIQSQTVVEDVDRLNTMMAEGKVPFGRNAAFQEELSPFLQSNNYRDAQALIESVKGNVGIDSLLRIKATGAGLGQVPQSQLDLLSTLLGKLSLATSQEQFNHTWNRMGQIYEEIWNAADEEMQELGFMPPEVFKRQLGVKATDENNALPPGITQDVWNEMTPDQKKLFEP